MKQASLKAHARQAWRRLPKAAVLIAQAAACLAAGTAAAQHAPRNASGVFLSGHSLTDNPLVDDFVAVAASLGKPLRYNQQIVIGSPIRSRTKGSSGWSGYSSGKNRQGQGMDVIGELRRPRTLGGGLYDALILTERHDLVGTLIWEDTVRYVRHFHDRLIEGNPRGTTYLYQSWLGLKDKGDPQSWITYEKAAAPVWRCVSTRINESLRAEGRTDRIRPLLAGLALAELVERATLAPGIAGITAGDVRETVGSLFADDVHLTRLSGYYVALVSYATLFGEAPVGAWAPSVVNRDQAASLQRLAWDFVSREHSDSRSTSECRTLMQSFCGVFWTYSNRVDQIESCRRHFSSSSPQNPFHYDAASDRSYWFPAP